MSVNLESNFSWQHKLKKANELFLPYAPVSKLGQIKTNKNIYRSHALNSCNKTDKLRAYI